MVAHRCPFCDKISKACPRRWENWTIKGKSNLILFYPFSSFNWNGNVVYYSWKERLYRSIFAQAMLNWISISMSRRYSCSLFSQADNDNPNEMLLVISIFSVILRPFTDQRWNKKYQKLSAPEASKRHWERRKERERFHVNIFKHGATLTFWKQLWQKALAPFIPAFNRNYCQYIYETTLLHCYKIIQIFYYQECRNWSCSTSSTSSTITSRYQKIKLLPGQFHFIGLTLIGAAVREQ